jgi:hypothetical protein
MLTSIAISTTGLRAARRSLLADINGAKIAAGVTAGLWYAFGAIPVYLEAAASLRLTPEAASRQMAAVSGDRSC